MCSKEKRAELIELDKKELLEYEQKLREKYNPDNLFKNKEEKTISIQNKAISSEKAMVEYKESVFTRIKNWFNRLLGRK